MVIKEIKDSVAYVLVGLSFKISNTIKDDYFDDNLDVKSDSPLWIKFKIWFGWHLYHNGCWFYS